MARWAETSENGTRAVPSRVMICSAASPEIVSVSLPVVITAAPACASTVVASGRAVERTV